MDVKIAIASSDGTTVNEHFGRARWFRIYRLHDKGYDYLETRKNNPVCAEHAHDDDLLLKAVEGLKDCRGVVAAQIGAGAIDALLMYRIMAFTLPGPIDKAMEALVNTRRFAYRK